MNRSEEIDRYLREEMTPEEKSAFKSRMAADPKLKAEVKEMDLISREVHHIGREQLRRDMHQWDASGQVETASSFSVISKLAAAIAVVVAASVGFYFYAGQKSPDDFIQHYPNYFLDQVRGENEDRPVALVEAFAAYEQKDYSRSARLFETYLQKNDQSPNVRFYLGLSLLFGGNPGPAVEEFRKIEEGDPSFQFGTEKRWYMGLGYWQLGAEKDALTIFKRLDSANYKEKEVDQIIDRLQ